MVDHVLLLLLSRLKSVNKGLGYQNTTIHFHNKTELVADEVKFFSNKM